MKQSLKNDKGMLATLPTNYPGEGNNEGMKSTGPKQSPSERLYKGKNVGFKNAEEEGTPFTKSYTFEE